MVPRFKLFGFPIVAQPTFFIMAVLLGWELGVKPTWQPIWISVVFGGVLLHELGHAFAARHFGCAVRIELYALGGRATATSTTALGPLPHVVLTAAGPAATVALGLLVLLGRWLAALPSGSLLAQVLGWLVWVNLGWGLLNLLPLTPLDGGHIVATALERVLPRHGRRLVYGASSCCWIALGAAGLMHRIWWAAIVSGALLVTNYRLLCDASESQETHDLWKSACDAWRDQDWFGAARKFRDAATSARGPQMRYQALQWLARSYLKLRYWHLAESVYDTIPAKYRTGFELEQEVLARSAWNRGDWEAVITACQITESASDDEEDVQWATEWRTWALLRLGRFAEAEILIRELASPGPELTVRLGLGDRARLLLDARDAEDWEGVIKAAQAILAQEGDEARRCWSLEHLAWAYLSQHDYQAAEAVIAEITLIQLPRRFSRRKEMRLAAAGRSSTSPGPT